jgi:hypothetical protein
MKLPNLSFKSLLSLVSVFAFAASASAQIFSEDFQTGFSTGSLSGQNGWTVGFGASPTPSSTVVFDSPNYFIQSTDNSYSLLNAGNFGLTNSSVVTLTFDLFVDSAVAASSRNAAFGIGRFDTTSSTNGVAPIFGIQGGNWLVRGWSFGTSTNARDTGGIVIPAIADNWYRVQSVWDLGANGDVGTATLSIMNLTAGETEFTQLFFDAAQTIATATLELDKPANTGAQNWSGIFVRTQNASADNLVVVPEPATYALALGLLVLIGIAARRRFK